MGQERFSEIPVISIKPNRFQPRTLFDQDKIKELADTLAVHGMIQPIVVREIGEGKHEIIAGERRWRAALQLGWSTLPAIINNLDDDETAAIALIENLQREQLSPIEEADAYAKLLALHGMTQEKLAIQLGVSQSTIANKLRLLKLPKAVQQIVLNKKITERHARAIIPLKNEDDQLHIIEEIISKGLSVKQTENRVSLLLTNKDEKPPSTKKIVSKDVRIAVNTIRQSLSMIAEHGITLDTEEEDYQDYYQIVIKIPKKR